MLNAGTVALRTTLDYPNWATLGRLQFRCFLPVGKSLEQELQILAKFHLHCSHVFSPVVIHDIRICSCCCCVNVKIRTCLWLEAVQVDSEYLCNYHTCVEVCCRKSFVLVEYEWTQKQKSCDQDLLLLDFSESSWPTYSHSNCNSRKNSLIPGVNDPSPCVDISWLLQSCHLYHPRFPKQKPKYLKNLAAPVPFASTVSYNLLQSFDILLPVVTSGQYPVKRS